MLKTLSALGELTTSDEGGTTTSWCPSSHCEEPRPARHHARAHLSPTSWQIRTVQEHAQTEWCVQQQCENAGPAIGPAMISFASSPFSHAKRCIVDIGQAWVGHAGIVGATGRREHCSLAGAPRCSTRRLPLGGPQGSHAFVMQEAVPRGQRAVGTHARCRIKILRKSDILRTGLPSTRTPTQVQI